MDKPGKHVSGNPGGHFEEFLNSFPTESLRFDHPHAVSLIENATGYLLYRSTDSAGAVGKAQGEALLTALQALESEDIKELFLLINSAGANFHEPMEGLFYLNEFLGALWNFRLRGIRIITVSVGWLYGGMALSLAAVSHEIRLSENARMGLFGSKILKDAPLKTPAETFQPPHLKLERLKESDLLSRL